VNYSHDPEYDWSGDWYTGALRDVTPLGVLVPPVGVQQALDFGLFKPEHDSGSGSSGLGGPRGGRGGPRGDWAGVALIGAVVAVSVLGFLAFRHVQVSAGTIRGVRSALRQRQA
jgi:hypothetical protein